MQHTHIKSELLLASVNYTTGDILYTFVFTYPRVLLSEVNTHRVFSRNTSSSRAIPSKRQRSRVWKDPFVPTKIGEAQKGMAPGAELGGLRRAVASLVWKGARLPALLASSILDRLGVHKGISNRLIEPWVWTQQLVSATDVDNFFNLRAHESAEPHLQELAYQAKQQVEWVRTLVDLFGPHYLQRYIDTLESTPYPIQVVKAGDWHLPFVSVDEQVTLGLHMAKRVSAARCARVSYNLPDTGKPSSLGDDLRIFDRLAGANPKHLSPVEHQATPMGNSDYYANFKGWRQFRKEIESGDLNMDKEFSA